MQAYLEQEQQLKDAVVDAVKDVDLEGKKKSSLLLSMINPELLAKDFEDLISGAVEKLDATEMYAALNQAINSQIAWHEKELKTLRVSVSSDGGS